MDSALSDRQEQAIILAFRSQKLNFTFIRCTLSNNTANDAENCCACACDTCDRWHTCSATHCEPGNLSRELCNFTNPHSAQPSRLLVWPYSMWSWSSTWVWCDCCGRRWGQESCTNGKPEDAILPSSDPWSFVLVLVSAPQSYHNQNI